jgi:hypothetical protein
MYDMILKLESAFKRHNSKDVGNWIHQMKMKSQQILDISNEVRN